MLCDGRCSAEVSFPQLQQERHARRRRQRSRLFLGKQFSCCWKRKGWPGLVVPLEMTPLRWLCWADDDGGDAVWGEYVVLRVARHLLSYLAAYMRLFSFLRYIVDFPVVFERKRGKQFTMNIGALRKYFALFVSCVQLRRYSIRLSSVVFCCCLCVVCFFLDLTFFVR